MKKRITLIAASLLGFVFILSAAEKPKRDLSPKDALEAAKKLANAGNHREAADAFKALLLRDDAEGGTLAAALAFAERSLQTLNAHDEREALVEDTVKRSGAHWQVLQIAGMNYSQLPQWGSIVDGKFHRNQHNGTGRSVYSEARDRGRALQLLTEAYRKMPADAAINEKGEFLMEFARRLLGPQQAWRLQVLTDLAVLPDYEENNQQRYNQQSGYPVDAAGQPVWFRVPKSFDDAANDGERWRFVMNEFAQINNNRAEEVKWTLANVFAQWFGVHTVGGIVPIGSSANEELAKTKTGPMALHTLTDEESCVRLATGAQRLTLPEEFQFMRLHRELAALGPDHAYSRNGRSGVISELLNRRQFTRAAEFIRESLPKENDKDQRKELEAQLDQITGAWGRFEPLATHPAGRKALLPLTFRNADKVSLTARKVDIVKLLSDTEAYLRSEPSGNNDNVKEQAYNLGYRLVKEGQDKYIGKIVAEWSADLQPAAEHWDRHVELASPLENAGAYWVTAKFAGDHVAHMLLWIDGLTLVESSQADGAHYFVCDATTGAPVPNAELRFFGYHKQWQDTERSKKKPQYVWSFRDFTAKSDENGAVIVPKKQLYKDDSNIFQWLITAHDDQGRTAHQGFESIYVNPSNENWQHFNIYTITDRPVYRPGQEVKWKTWARQVTYDPNFKYNIKQGRKFTVTITDPRRQKLLDKEYTADEFVSWNDTFKLADDATLGVYTFRISGHQHTFRVEEYKKPEFEVLVSAPEKPIALGESFEVKVKADYYFGGPVKEARVKYKVTRTPNTQQWFPYGPWDWLYGRGYGWHSVSYLWYPGSQRWCWFGPMWPWMQRNQEPPEMIAEGEQPIGADGTLTVKVDTAMAKELHGNEDHRYEIEAEVTDSSRRTITGTGTVLAARRSFDVFLWLNGGFYRTGEPATASVTTRTLDGRNVNASGKLRVLRVTYAADGKPIEEEVDAFDLKTGEDAAKQTLKWKRAGQYRIAATLKDANGREQEASCFTLVRGDDNDNAKDLRFDDLELLTTKDEYQPGDDMEVLINTNRPGSTVALFVRAANGVYPAPVWLHLDGKSTTHHFTVAESDQPNFFIEAFTVSDAKLHRVIKQILVPPVKRIANVELEPDKKNYLPRDKATAKLRVKTQDGKPLVGQIVLTAYDKALEYISGGSNQPDIRPFFWGWKRQHYPQLRDSLHASEAGLVRKGETAMQALGYGYGWGGGGFGNFTAGGSFATATSGMVFGGGSGSTMDLNGFSTYNGVTTISGGTLNLSSGGVFPMSPAALSAAGGSNNLAFDAVSGLMKAGDGTLRRANGQPDPAFAPLAMIRSKLADSAVWVASASTNEAGEASIEFEMPDNLTTWKLRAWVMGPQTQVGEASVEVITRKDVMVRLQAPRFFVEKDEAVLSANVHNELDKPQTVRGVIELEGGVLALMVDAAEQQAEVPAHGEKRFDWRVRVTGEGEAKVRVKALAQGDSDAMEMTFPAYFHGALKTESWSLALRPDEATGKLKFTVPAERRAEASRLVVRYSPTLAMALVDALPYLTDYPYGCTEQTLNRFVPTVITLGVLNDLGIDLKDIQAKRGNLNAQEIGNAADRAKRWQQVDRHGNLRNPVFDEDEVNKMARVGIGRLKNMRDSDGGWGWFPGGRESSTHITAQVVHGLLTAKRAGMKVDDDLIDRAAQWLERHEARELAHLNLPEKHEDHKTWPDNEDALVHVTLVECGRGDKAMRARLYQDREHISRMNVALLGLAFHSTKQMEQRDMCLRNVRQFVHEDAENQSAWLEQADGAAWWHWWGDSIETETAFLRLLVAAEPKSELAPRIAKHLLNNRRNGSYWKSTRDTAAVIEALAAFVKASGEAKPEMKLTVLVDGKPLKEIAITPNNLFTYENTLTLDGDALTTGEHSIEFRKEGNAPLYANAYLTVFSKEDNIKATGLEVKIARKFFKLTEEKHVTDVAGSRGQALKQRGVKYARAEIHSGDPLKSGDLVEVQLTVESKNDYEYILLEDPKPAGFEPASVRSGWNYDGLPAYQEFRDAKVAFFVERLPRGTSAVSYRVRAEVPGKFSALPTKAEAMYSPELRANADEWKAVIGE